MISVIIPTFKRKEMLFFEIEKLKEQKNVDIEIIVINDDIKDDPTDEILNKYPEIKYIKYPTKIGPGQKRQIGFMQTSGKYISTPDDDDYLIDDHFFEKAEKLLEQDESLSFVSGSSIILYEDEKDDSKKYEKAPLNVKGKYEGIDYLQNIQGQYQKPLSSFPTVFRKQSLENAGFINQIETSDVSLYMLACLSGNAYFLHDFVGVYRIHSRSLTTKKSSSDWINNVLRQKEYIFEQIKNEIDNPSKWWLRHVDLSYRFYANTSRNRKQKLKLLIWCYKHNHGYFIINKYIIRQFVLSIIMNR